MPPHAPCRLQRSAPKADAQSVQLCLHTLRADCNGLVVAQNAVVDVFASTRSVQIATQCTLIITLPAESFASTRSVQIATRAALRRTASASFASTRSVQIATSAAQNHLSAACFASTRSVQIATKLLHNASSFTQALPPHAPCRLQRQKCTELQYALFRTCVESVDSFSVLNKSMLR